MNDLIKVLRSTAAAFSSMGDEMGTQTTSDLLNDFPDLKDWCGHWFVSMKTWRCPDCNHALNKEAQNRLRSVPLVAPKGHLWIFQLTTQPNFKTEDDEPFDWVSTFTDINRIPKQMVRDSIIDANSIRDSLKQIHWYQCVFNTNVFEGWDEAEDQEHHNQYKLILTKIDSLE